ncbi:MAG: hypothetical protein FD139_2070 [Methylocystaceae bacterium]|nr:MAG: hypothetical protein FD148_1527 [Methylocystaceae bacterium]KAF0213361.1 MAG: hypothetical protein FD172_494 [Methylocystaceae bacterium]TXT44818.1 MAG: hypothetical protein FD139_2070 [Methylocystaceae bacterium]
MTAIDARMIEDGDPFVFDVTVRDQGSETQHRVTLSQNDLLRFGGGADAQRFISAAFRFLLDREAKESILARFDMSDVAGYFPEFEQKLPEYLA